MSLKKKDGTKLHLTMIPELKLEDINPDLIDDKNDLWVEFVAYWSAKRNGIFRPDYKKQTALKNSLEKE